MQHAIWQCRNWVCPLHLFNGVLRLQNNPEHRLTSDKRAVTTARDPQTIRESENEKQFCKTLHIMIAIYHTIVTLKGGPLNVWQSNPASGTVHWILHCWPNNLSCISRLPKCEMFESWKEDKADIAFSFSKLCHLLRGKQIVWPLSMIVQRGKMKVSGLSVVKRSCVFGGLSLTVLCTALNILIVYVQARSVVLA